MSADDAVGQALLIVFVPLALALACYGLRDIWARRRAWGEYERRRDAIENGRRIGNVAETQRCTENRQ